MLKSFLGKFCSVKVWCVIWAAVMVTLLIQKGQADTSLAVLLAAIIPAYMGINVTQDWITKDTK